ncbi:hypothetical protein PMIN04_006119 [Paraphaeosphaeria minitans]
MDSAGYDDLEFEVGSEVRGVGMWVGIDAGRDILCDIRRSFVDSTPPKVAKMGAPRSETAEKNSGHSFPVPHSDFEIGSVDVVSESTKDGDEALRFLKNQHNVGRMTAENERKLVKKIDWMIMPLMWCC